ncbi:MAG: PHP domain-containing protein [Bdellovibrionales bacterium]|nr:PHP domain-containing protein [Bdellovibrionales bacterium]
MAKSEGSQKEQSPMGLRQKIQKSSSRGKNYVMDLRIHSPASLGYLGIEGIDTAPAMVRLAKVKGLDVIAVTDFYSGGFIDRVAEAAKGSSLTVIPGTVIRATLPVCNDVTLLCLFPEESGGALIEQFLTSIGMPQGSFGNPTYVVQRDFHAIMKNVEELNGVIIPSRMDKTPHQMGAIPALVDDFGFRAFDLAYPDSAAFFKQRWPKIKFQLFSFSNANALAQVGSRIAKVKMKEAGFAGLREIMARDEMNG